jgi:hypothetical protein
MDWWSDGVLGRSASFEKLEPVGIEQVAAAGRHSHLRMFAAVMHGAEDGEQLRPRAVTLVHGVRVTLGVGAQSLEQAVDGVIADVKAGGAFGLRVGGHDAPVFGEEQKDQPHEDGEQAGVNVVGIPGEDGAEELALGALVGGLEPAQEFVKGVEDLAGELGGDGALVFAAAGEQRGQAGCAGRRGGATLAQQHVQRGEDGPARHFGHVTDGEGEVAGVLAVRGVDEADLGAVGQQADGHAGFAEEALKPLRGRSGPGAFIGGGAGVEVRGDRERLREQQPGLVGVFRARVFEGERRGDGLAFLQSDGERIGQRPGGVEAVEAIFRPLEETPCEGGEVGDGGDWVFAVG